MAKISVCGKKFDIDVVVFDKDGCLFGSQAFWEGLARIRYDELIKVTTKKVALEWLNLVGIKSELDSQGNLVVTEVDPMGTLAIAPPHEEAIILATVLQQNTGWRWPQCRETAQEIFAKADANMDLASCIKPKKGFPDIFDRLHDAGVTFGIATSDDLDRAKRSVEMYSHLDYLSFLITPVDVVKNKPDREILDLVASKFNVDTSKIMMVGDNFVDVEMAKNAGSVGIGIPEYDFTKERMKPFATVIAESLDDIIIEEA
ncbi:MAG: HAD-IA family hydrolase [Prevotellaceae bacterium]|nr:HAD-IA family hydrolase [Prevotellaceae bacterium]